MKKSDRYVISSITKNELLHNPSRIWKEKNMFRSYLPSKTRQKNCITPD